MNAERDAREAMAQHLLHPDGEEPSEVASESAGATLFFSVPSYDTWSLANVRISRSEWNTSSISDVTGPLQGNTSPPPCRNVQNEDRPYITERSPNNSSIQDRRVTPNWMFFFNLIPVTAIYCLRIKSYFLSELLQSR